MFSNKKGSEIIASTIIEKGTVFTGNLNCKNPTVIKGSFHGKISCDSSITLETDSKVKGNIEAENVIINGEIEGDIIAKQKVSILPQGIVSGNVTAGELEINAGAVFNGECKIQPVESNQYIDSVDKDVPTYLSETKLSA